MSGAEAADADGDLDGRYVYCLVDVSGRETGEGEDPERPDAPGSSERTDDPGASGATDDLDAPGAPDVTGVDGEDPYLVTAGGIGALVHACEGVYESEDPELVQRWLLAHQSVVDAAADRFGTPLPFRFDVVFEGGDAAVLEWLRGAADRVREHLDEFAGRREYRVAVEWAEDAETHLRERDADLADLHEEATASDSGRGYLVERQYDSRLREVRAERGEELADALRSAVDPVAVETERRERSTALGEAGGDDAVARLAVLADLDDEERLGERLDAVAGEPDAVVRFTGPWPPYTFAPDLGGE